MTSSPLRSLRLGLALVLLCAPLFCSAGCASAGSRKPDVAAAQTATDILSAVSLLQKEINRLTAARTLPVPTADQMTAFTTVVHEKSGQLITALEAYHRATTPLEKQSKAALAQTLLAQLSGPLGQLLGVQLPPGLATSITSLIGTVLRAVAAVQAEVAQGLSSGSQPLLVQ